MAPHTYRIASFGMAAYFVVFSLVWFGCITWFMVGGELLHHWSSLTALGAAVALVIAVTPAYVTARLPYKATLTEEGECEFRALLRRKRVRVHAIRSIVSDDEGEYIYIRHDGGKLAVVSDEAFKPLLVRLVELNPAIDLEDWLRREVEAARSAA